MQPNFRTVLAESTPFPFSAHNIFDRPSALCLLPVDPSEWLPVVPGTFLPTWQRLKSCQDSSFSDKPGALLHEYPFIYSEYLWDITAVLDEVNKQLAAEGTSFTTLRAIHCRLLQVYELLNARLSAIDAISIHGVTIGAKLTTKLYGSLEL